MIVKVWYLDQAGQSVASDTEVECAYGDTQVMATPVDLKADYAAESDAPVTVHVDENGASPAEVRFIYRYEAPVPKVALVGVRYVRPDGESFYAYSETCQEGVKNTIKLDWSQVDPAWNYEIASPEEVEVAVDGNGVATPSEVVFQFKNEVNAYVTVRYQDMATGRDIATAQQVLCYVGNNIITAEPNDLEGNYALPEGAEPSRSVTLSRDGVLTPSEVVFQYAYLPTPSPLPATPTPLPYDTAVEGYGYPSGTSVNFRSGPTTEENNVIGTVRSSDLARILGQVKNAKGETWYAVEINGQAGYLKDTVLRVLTDAEVAALFNYTLPPTAATATPVPTEIPDGAAIDRWGTTNSSVNFRKTPETINSGKNANKISSLKKNARVWIYSSVTENGEKWYSVRVNGKDGYLMAQYVDMMSQQDSDSVQSSLNTPMATQVPVVTPTPVATDTPTPAPTETIIPLTPPPELATATPVPYRGYALTRGTTALRTGVSMTDDTILETLPAYALVYVSGQTYVDGTPWSSVQSVASGNFGFMLQDVLQTISNEEAKPYLDSLQPPVVETATPVPEQVYGYGMTVGDGVPMRAFPDTNAEILDRLPYGAVANVQGQSFDGGNVWHVVQYNGMWGFIREDQLRILSAEESAAYEQSLQEQMQTPEPIVALPTPEPVTEQSLSSYGHVTSNSGKVNLRAEPSTQSARIRLLDNYAFALVLGSVTNDEGLWYHVSQAGTEGYIAGNYFKVLSMGELTQFLQSDEYINANNEESGSGNSTTQIQPVEDYNRTVWQNPALTASYEPFNPYLTPTPDPERIVTPAPTIEPTPEPTAQIAPVDPMLDGTPVPATTQQGGSAWPWVLLALAAVGGGGAYYAYTIKQKNEKRRQAMRAQQARQNRAASAQQPQMRAASNNPTSAQQNRTGYTGSSAPFMPPQGGAPRPAQRPANGPATGSVNQGTAAYRPVRPTGTVPQKNGQNPQAPAQQATQAFAPSQVNQAKAAAVKQETQVFQPSRATPTAAAVKQETQVFQPSQATPMAAAVKQETQVFQPSQATPTAAAVKQETQVFQPSQATPTAESPKAEAPATAKASDPANAPAASGTYQRRRRSERHQYQDDDNA